MAFSITNNALLASQKLKVEPQLVLEIEGVTTLFGAVEISRIIRIGDTGLVIGDEWRIGGLSAIEDQADIISVDDSGTKIDQQLYPDKGSVSSVSSIQLVLIDRNLVATQLISPGVVIDEILGVKATLWVGFKNTAFKEDYVPVFSGVIDDVDSGSGKVKINIAHPEQLKRQQLFSPVTVTLNAPINNSVTTIALTDASGLPTYTTGPDGAQDTTIQFYVQFEDEIISYAGISGNSLTGCTRGALGTTAAAHTWSGGDAITGKSITELSGTPIDIALKLMLSGMNGPYKESVAATRFNHPTPLTTVANSVFFLGVDLARDYGVAVGDFVTIAGATHGANNCTLKAITELDVTEDGSYMVVDGVTFVTELTTSALVAFSSQYDSGGYGLAMKADQVDVAEHVYWNEFLLSAYAYRFTIAEEINGKDFLDKEVYMPIGAFSLPRQGRCSMGYHIGPLMSADTKTLNRDNIKDPDKIRIRRTTNRNFYNTIIYKFDKHPVTGNFASGVVTQDEDSRAQIQVGNKALIVESSGLRADGAGGVIADQVSTRYLSRYRFAAEFIEAVGVFFRDGYTIEPGDVVVLDPDQLQMANTQDGTRNKPAKLFSVINKSLNLKTGDISLSLLDPNFDGTERYGTVSPSTKIVAGSTTTALLIQDSYGSLYPGNEAKKWENYLGQTITVHSYDWSFSEDVTLLSIDPANRYKLHLDPATPLSVAPSAGYIIDVPAYPTSTDATEDAIFKASHAFLSAAVSVTSGVSGTQFHVGSGDVAKFHVGSKVRVRNADFSADSDEVKVTAVSGTTITVEAMGFTPNNTYKVELLDFADDGKSYRIY